MPDPRPQARARRADERIVRVALTLCLVLLLAPAAADAATTPILVQLEPGVSAGERADLHADAGVEHVKASELPRTEIVLPTDTSTATALRRLNRDADVRWAAPNVTLHATAITPDDDYFGQQWALASPSGPDLETLAAWDVATGAGEQIAVVDTGVDSAHEDLQGALAGGVNYLGSGQPADDDGHGTHVAGIIAARRNNGIGVSGVAPDATVIPYKVLGANGEGSLDDVMQAFDDAGAAGVPIVSASLGSDHLTPGSAVANSLEAAFDSVMATYPGTLYVVAAGNEHANDDASPSYPCSAAASNLLCVGASGTRDEPSCYSNVGHTSVDVFAPGDDILSTVPAALYAGSDYLYMSGTSMATPFVAGVAALAQEHDATLTGALLAAHIRASVDAVPALGSLSVSGGRLDAARAVGLTSAEGAGSSGAWAYCPDDADADGIIDALDKCPTKPAKTADGCPVPVTTTPTTPAPTTTPTPISSTPAAPADSDADGRPDISDLCPTEAAGTTTGCPIPGLKSIGVKPSRAKHRATIKVRTTRAATVALTVERRVCNKQGRKCKWRKAASQLRSTTHNLVTFTVRKLGRGKYRVGVRLSSPAGKARLVRSLFRV